MTSTCTLEAVPSQLDADDLVQSSCLPNITTPGRYKPYYQYVSTEPPRSIRTCMDYHRRSQYESDATAESYRQNATPSRQSRQPESIRHQPSTSPLPQSQWAEPSNRPRDFGVFVASNPHARGLEDSSIHRTQSIGPTYRISDPSPKAATIKQRRRPRPLDQERLHQPLDHTMLYPQLSPYAVPQEDMAYLDFLPRSVSQPATPGYLQPGNLAPEMHTTTLPRSPTYPPAGERVRGRSAHALNDAAFNDEHEFRLFVEATAGLGPVPSMGQRELSPVSPQRQHQEEYTRAPHRMDSEYMISPLAETPTTIEALQHLAQMPQSTHRFQTESQTERQQLQILESEFDSWLQAPSSHRIPPQRPSLPHSSASAPIDDWRSVPDVSPIDDELPDYASSQAQAQAAQRVAATRRAEELQRRWQESGSRTIRYA